MGTSPGQIIATQVRELVALTGTLDEDAVKELAAAIDAVVAAESAARDADDARARRDAADGLRSRTGHVWPEEGPH